MTSKVEVVKSFFQDDSGFGNPWGYALVKNVSDEVLHAIRFEFSALDESGVVICTSHDWIADFKPGDTVQLKMYETDFAKATALRLDKAEIESSP